MNTNEKEIDPKSVDETAKDKGQEIEAPACKNGVCELNWQPKRPQAA